MKSNNTILNVTIEIPKNSSVKYEFNRFLNKIVVDRVLYGSNFYPQNYGFIPQTLDYDGDELDCLVISNQPLFPGCIVPTKIIGAMEMIDDGDKDTKLIGVINCDPRFENINSLTDLAKNYLLEIKDFFQNYKNLQNKKVIIKGFKDKKWAMNEYKKCLDLKKKYGNLSKDSFLRIMQKSNNSKLD